MPHNYRREGFGRPHEDRGQRSAWHQDRHTRDGDRYSPNQEVSFNRDQDSDRSYFAESSDQDRDSTAGWQQHGGRNTNESRNEQEWRSQEPSRQGERSRSGQLEDQRFNTGQNFNESRYQSRPQRDAERNYAAPYRGPSEMARWHERGSDEGDYFGTGSYYGAYSTGPSSRASGRAPNEHGYLPGRNPMWHENSDTRREDDQRSAGTSGSSRVYAHSNYGAQGGFDRPYGGASNEQRSFGQDYREQFAEQRYGRQPEFGYGFAESSSGAFRGRGPKGYERSDERLREIICERLTDDPRIDASEVHIEVKDRVVKLTGTVADRRTKYEIEDVVERCGGVKDIDNQVRVSQGRSFTGAGSTQSSGGASGSGSSSGEAMPGTTAGDAESKGTGARNSKRN